MTLDADTELTPVGEGRWRARISADWGVVRGPFGGYVSALLARAAQSSGRPLRSLSVHFVDAPAAGEAEVVAVTERVGRSTTALSLRLEQGGRPVALALAGCAERRDGEPEWADLAAPEAPPPEHCEPVPWVEGAPGFHQQLDIRWIGGGAPGMPSQRARNLAWLRLRGGGRLDELTVVALSDGWMPAALSKLGRFAIVPTFDLTIHIRAPLPAPGDWLLADYRSSFSAGGAWEEDGELWTQDGTLVAQSRQLAMIREIR